VVSGDARRRRRAIPFQLRGSLGAGVGVDGYVVFESTPGVLAGLEVCTAGASFSLSNRGLLGIQDDKGVIF